MNRSVGTDSVFQAPSNGRSTGGATDRTIVPASGSTRSSGWDYPELLIACFVASAKAPAVTVLSLLAILAACGATLVVGPPQMAVYGHDVLGFLNGGWRVLQGQVPHVDFYSAMGPVYYLLWAAAFKVLHYRVEGIVYVTTLLGVVLGLWSFAVARNRLGALCAMLCTVLLVCLWLAPFAIGEPFYLTSYAMQYNRLGYVLFLLLFIELFGAPDQESPAQGEWWGGCSSGLALGLLLFLKASFFIVALVPIAYVYVFRIKNKRHGLLLVCGFLAVLLPMSWYLHGHLGSLVRDLRIAAGARVAQRTLKGPLILISLRNFTTIAALGGLALLAQAIPGEEKKKAFSSLSRVWLWLFLVLACDFVLAASNQQRSGLPLSLIAILLLADQLVRSMALEQRQMQRALAACLLVVVVATALPPITDLVNSWESELMFRMGRYPTGFHIDAPQMAGLGFKDHSDAAWGQSSNNGHLMTGRVNDGIALLRQHTTATERIVCLCFADPFSYALLRPPPRGGSPFFAYGFNFSETAAPTAERILGDADVIIYPKADEEPPTVATLMRICEPILSKKYRHVAESEQWVLLKRHS